VQELAPGSVFAGHRIESLAGRGGMGVVYRATHLALNRPVALKVIAPQLAADADFRARFEHESRIAASIDHRHVIPIYHAGEEDGQLFITMRYVEGTDLRELIQASGALAPQRAAAIVAQVAEALDAAHARGLVHRDVKPANVLIDPGDDCFLTDFGLTKVAGEDGGPTKTGQWVGTIDYVAPEQIQGHPLDARADIYALGCVLYHALVGRIPYPRDSDVAKMFAHVNDGPPQLPAGVPPALNEVVARAMAKMPSERYPSAGDLGRAAVAAATDVPVAVAERSVAVGDAAPAPTQIGGVSTPREHSPTQALPPSQPQQPVYPPAPPTSSSRKPWLILAAVVILALGAGVAALAAGGVFSSDSGHGPPTVTTTQGGGGTTTQTTDTTTPPKQLVPAAQVNETLGAYESAFTNRDADAIGRLVTANVVRKSDAGTMRGRAAVVSEYRGQFENLTNPTYRLENISIRRGTDDATVSANYVIEATGPPSTGQIRFHMVATGDGGLLINRINAVADRN
jgi:serine/threonine protein kinase